jgi:hypothetical protein
MSVAQAKVPTVIASSLLCLILGAAGGVIGAHFLGDPLAEKKVAAAPAGDAVPDDSAPPGGGRGGPGGGARGGPGGPGGGGRGGPGGGGPGGGMGGGRGAGGPKQQLAQLVTKLDLLTGQPLTIQLTPDQRKKAHEILKGLDADELSDDAARARLDDLTALLKDHRPTLDSVTFRAPGGGPGGPGGGPGGGGPQPPTANPFKADENGKHLKALQARLGA